MQTQAEKFVEELKPAKSWLENNGWKISWARFSSAHKSVCPLMAVLLYQDKIALDNKEQLSATREKWTDAKLERRFGIRPSQALEVLAGMVGYTGEFSVSDANGGILHAYDSIECWQKSVFWKAGSALRE